jgi:rRNA maturation endonuclease Nob1
VQRPGLRTIAAMFDLGGLGKIEVLIVGAVFVAILLGVRMAMRSRSNTTTHMTKCARCGERAARALGRCPKCGGALA